MVSRTGHIVKEKAEQESSVVKSSFLLDTEIDCSVLALGISERTEFAEVMLEKESEARRLERVQSKDNAQAKEVGQQQQQQQRQPQSRHQHQLFDFVHIRFQNSGVLDGTRVFHLAFEQTKPGGWIEVVEATHAGSPMKGSDLSPISNQRATHTSRSVALGDYTSNSACWVKKQLLAAGFVDVEEKSTQSSWAPKSSPLQRLWGLGKLVKGLCAVLWQWNYGETGNVQRVQGEARASLSSPNVFVVARKPPS